MFNTNNCSSYLLLTVKDRCAIVVVRYYDWSSHSPAKELEDGVDVIDEDSLDGQLVIREVELGVIGASVGEGPGEDVEEQVTIPRIAI